MYINLKKRMEWFTLGGMFFGHTPTIDKKPGFRLKNEQVQLSYHVSGHDWITDYRETYERDAE